MSFFFHFTDSRIINNVASSNLDPTRRLGRQGRSTYASQKSSSRSLSTLGNKNSNCSIASLSSSSLCSLSSHRPCSNRHNISRRQRTLSDFSSDVSLFSSSKGKTEAEKAPALPSLNVNTNSQGLGKNEYRNYSLFVDSRAHEKLLSYIHRINPNKREGKLELNQSPSQKFELDRTPSSKSKNELISRANKVFSIKEVENLADRSASGVFHFDLLKKVASRGHLTELQGINPSIITNALSYEGLRTHDLKTQQQLIDYYWGISTFNLPTIDLAQPEKSRKPRKLSLSEARASFKKSPSVLPPPHNPICLWTGTMIRSKGNSYDTVTKVQPKQALSSEMANPYVTAEWKPLAAGPTAAFHTACIIRGVLYIHGGVTVRDGRTPSNKLYMLALPSTMWTEVSRKDKKTRIICTYIRKLSVGLWYCVFVCLFVAFS